MKKLWRIEKWLREMVCKITGHHYDLEDMFMFNVYNDAENREKFVGRTVRCPMCQTIWRIVPKGVEKESLLIT